MAGKGRGGSGFCRAPWSEFTVHQVPCEKSQGDVRVSSCAWRLRRRAMASCPLAVLGFTVGMPNQLRVEPPIAYRGYTPPSKRIGRSSTSAPCARSSETRAALSTNGCTTQFAIEPREDERLRRLIRASYRGSHGVCGAPRILLDLREAGKTCGKHRVARLMRINNTRALYRYRTPRIRTISRKS